MKKLAGACLTLLLLVCLLGSAWAQSAAVVDGADLFTASEEAQLTELIEAFRSETGFDFAIITSDEAHYGTQQAVADALYEQGGYGLGEERSGILYYIDMYERIPYLSTAGEMIDYMTDARIEAAHEACYSALASGRYAQAARTMIATVQSDVRRGIPEGQYQYDERTGQRLTSYHRSITAGEALFCLVLALVCALAYVAAVQRSYSLKGSTYEYAFRQNCQVTLTDSADDYLRTTTTRTRKASPPSTHGGGHSGGSRVHTSSGGMRHGGGAGRKF